MRGEAMRERTRKSRADLRSALLRSTRVWDDEYSVTVKLIDVA